jgi:hypothetical protein
MQQRLIEIIICFGIFNQFSRLEYFIVVFSGDVALLAPQVQMILVFFRVFNIV